MNIAQFLAKYNGKIVSYDAVPADAGQCVQLVELWARDGLGVRLPLYPDAAAYWERPVPGYVKISKAQGLPQTNDMVIFDRGLQGSGGHGHMDICIANGARNAYTGFDSNWGGLAAKKVAHDYSHVLGYLRLTPHASAVPVVKRIIQAVHPIVAPASYYVIRQGDTLGAIALRYRTSVSNLVRLNRIINPNLIYPGQRLRIK